MPGRVRTVLLVVVVCAAGISGGVVPAVAQAAAPAADSARSALPARAAESPGLRVARLARQLLFANVSRCPKQRWDYGLYAHRAAQPVAAGSAQPKASPAEPDGFLVVQVWPGGPAERAGVSLGDRLLAANGASWADGGFGEVFRKAEQGDPDLAQIQLRLARGEGELTLTVAGQRACAVYTVLVPRAVVNASANGTTTFINSGLEQALPQDDELAAVIAHEVAHVILGHAPALARSGSAPGSATGAGSGAGADRAKRSQFEQDADALGVRLMLAAGLDPAAAMRAVATLAAKSRGPISRLLGLYGSYLSTAERQRFLQAQIALARAEAAVPSSVAPCVARLCEQTGAAGKE